MLPIHLYSSALWSLVVHKRQKKKKKYHFKSILNLLQILIVKHVKIPKSNSFLVFTNFVQYLQKLKKILVQSIFSPFQYYYSQCVKWLNCFVVLYNFNTSMVSFHLNLNIWMSSLQKCWSCLS